MNQNVNRSLRQSIRSQHQSKSKNSSKVFHKDHKKQQKSQMSGFLKRLRTLNDKFRSIFLLKGFYSMLTHKNGEKAKLVKLRYLSSFIKQKRKLNIAKGFQKLCRASTRRKNVLYFCKFLTHLRSSKKQFYFSFFFKKLQFKLIRDSNSETPLKRQSVKSQHQSREKKGPFNSTSSSLNKHNQKIDFSSQQQSKEQEQKKLMEFSEQVRESLKKIQRFDRFIYPKQAQITCKQILYNELRRLQKIKNSSKTMRGKMFDSELAITALYNHVKLVSEMNSEINSLKPIKQNSITKTENNKTQLFPQAQIKEMKEKLKAYDLYQKRLSLILNKIQNNQGWNRQLEMLKKDEKLANLKAAQGFIKLKEDVQKRETENTQKIILKVESFLQSFSQIKIKNIPLERKIFEVNRLVQMNSRKSSKTTEVLEVLNKHFKNQLEQKQVSEKPNERIVKLAKENKNLQEKIQQLNNQIEQLNQSLIKGHQKQQMMKQQLFQFAKQRKQLQRLQQVQRKNIQIQKNHNMIADEASAQLKVIKECFNEKKEYFHLEVKKLIKIYRKNVFYQSYVDILTMFGSLQFGSQRPKSVEKKFLRTPEKQSLQSNLILLMKQCETQIKRNSFKNNIDAWHNIFSGKNDNEQIDFLLKLMKLWSEKYLNIQNYLEERNDTIDKLENRQNIHDVSIHKFQQIIKTEQFIINDECWSEINSEFDDSFTQNLVQLFKSISQISREKILHERKQNQKAIKIYEHDMMELNNCISILEKKILQKDKQAEIQSPAKVEEKRSLSRSRRSNKSASSEKDSQIKIKNLKTSMEAYALQEKNMLQKIVFLEHENEKMNENIRFLESENFSLRNEWSRREKQHQLQVESIRNLLEIQHKVSTNELVSQIKNITEGKDLELKHLHIELQRQKQKLENEITLLTNQLKHRQDYNELKHTLSLVEKENDFLRTQSKTSINESPSRIIELEAMLDNLRKQQQAIIQNQVTFALKNQEADFNRFLQQDNFERQQYYENVVIPERLQQHRNNHDQQYQQMKASYEMNKLQLETAIQINQKQIKKIEGLQEELSEATIKGNYQHQFKELERSSQKEISDLKARLQVITNSQQSQAKLLKEVIQNQKAELHELQMMTSSLKQTKEQLIADKQFHHLEIEQIVKKNSSEIQSIRRQFEQKNTKILDEKYRLEQELREKERTKDNSSSLKILQIETRLKGKQMELKQMEEITTKKSVEIEDQRRKNQYIQHEIHTLKNEKSELQSYIRRLEVDLTTLSGQNIKYQQTLTEMESKSHHLQEQMMRIKTESSVDNAEYMREEVRELKKQIILMNKQKPKAHQITNLLKDMSGQRSGDYDQGQLQILRKIDEEVSDLVETNRQLETKLAIVEGCIEGNISMNENANLILVFQHHQQSLINYLLTNEFLPSTQPYNDFIQNSRSFLNTQSYEQYFDLWSSMMKNLLNSIHEKQSKELKQKAEEMLELKAQMTEILDKQIEYSEDENFEALEKYKMIFTDIKFLLKEYLKTEDQEYLWMICRSLGFDNVQQ